jgi:flagellar biosynthetic protein FliR
MSATQVNLDLLPLLNFFCVWVRGGIWVMLLPWFGAGHVPVVFRIGLSGCIAYAFAEGLPYVEGVQQLVDFGMAIVNEVFIGLWMVFGAKIIFYALEFAAQLMASEMSLAMSSQFNPGFGGQSTTVHQALFYFTIVIFWSMGLPFVLLNLFRMSFEVMPPGSSFLQWGSMAGGIRASASIFIIGLQMAAPLLAVNFLINIAFAVLGKIVPRMNVFVTSFTIRLAAGFLILLMSIGLLTQILTDEGRQMPQTIDGLFER